MPDILISAGGSLAIFGVVALVWWNFDRVLSQATREETGARIDGPGAAPDWSALQAAGCEALRNSVSPRLPAGRFLRTVLISVLCGFAVFLIAYLTMVTGFARQIVNDGFAMWRVAQSVLIYGLPVAFLCAYMSFFLQGLLLDRIERSSVKILIFYLIFDVAVRLAVFALLSVLVFAYFAQFHGRFGGSVLSAVRVVPATIASAATFSNIAGVYFYAAMFSAFPLFILLTLKIVARSPRLQAAWRFAVAWFPIADRPLRFGVLVLAAFLAAGAFVSSLLLDAAAYYAGAG